MKDEGGQSLTPSTATSYYLTVMVPTYQGQAEPKDEEGNENRGSGLGPSGRRTRSSSSGHTSSAAESPRAAGQRPVMEQSTTLGTPSPRGGGTGGQGRGLHGDEGASGGRQDEDGHFRSEPKRKRKRRRTKRQGEERKGRSRERMGRSSGHRKSPSSVRLIPSVRVINLVKKARLRAKGRTEGTEVKPPANISRGTAY